MPTSSSGLYKLVLEQTYLGSTIFNVFGYLNSLSLDDEQDLCAQAFDEDIMATLATLLSANLTFDSIRCINITGALVDEVISPSQANGDVIGADLAPFVGVPFRYNRATKDTRNGSKRFSGMVEGNTAGETWLAAYVTSCNAFALLLAADITTVGGIFEPIILGAETGTPGLFNYNTLSSVQFLDRVTSQVSRKSF